jgi:hypothetical protein
MNDCPHGKPLYDCQICFRAEDEPMASRHAAPDSPEDRETMKRDFERGVYEREQAESETPETDMFRQFSLSSTQPLEDLHHHLTLTLASHEGLERRLSLAQTEIKGHMRIEDELRADVERAYQVLELHGVPRERAKSVSNGIDVLASRFDKQNHFYEQALARENEAQARIAELEKDAARYRWLRDNHRSGGDHRLVWYLPRTEALDANGLDAAIDAALKSRA